MGTSLSTIRQNVANNDKLIANNSKNVSILEAETKREHSIPVDKQIKDLENLSTEEKAKLKFGVCNQYRAFENRFATPPEDFTQNWTILKGYGTDPNNFGFIKQNINPTEGRICNTIYDYIMMRLRLLESIDRSINELSYCVLSKQALKDLIATHGYYYDNTIANPQTYNFDFMEIIENYIQKKDENDKFKLLNKGEKDITLPHDQKQMNKVESLLKNLYSEQKKYVDKIKEIYYKLHSRYYVTSEELAQLINSFDKIHISLKNNCQTTFNLLNNFDIYVKARANGNVSKLDIGGIESFSDKAKNLFRRITS